MQTVFSKVTFTFTCLRKPRESYVIDSSSLTSEPAEGASLYLHCFPFLSLLVIQPGGSGMVAEAFQEIQKRCGNYSGDPGHVPIFANGSTRLWSSETPIQDSRVNKVWRREIANSVAVLFRPASTSLAICIRKICSSERRRSTVVSLLDFCSPSGRITKTFLFPLDDSPPLRL